MLSNLTLDEDAEGAEAAKIDVGRVLWTRLLSHRPTKGHQAGGLRSTVRQPLYVDLRFNGLDESFAGRLHPSVRGDYAECLEEKRREDEYEARNG